MAVLYRKYRPQKFSEVVGQGAILQTLKNALKGNSFSHAYLFTGSRGVGKTTVARLLAKALNCTNLKDGEVCLRCENCLAITQGNFLDLVEIDAASNTGVDNIRELIEHTQFSPSQGKIKVFIIDEVHMLSRGAFNALLKTLEEPPAHVVFVLATTEVHKVPATIISRSQRFDFRRLDETEIGEQLQKVLKEEKLKVPEGVLKLITLRAEGSLRDALSLLDKVLSLGGEASIEEVEKLLGITPTLVSEELFRLILDGNTSAIPDFFSKLLSSGTDFVVFCRDFLEYLRKSLVYKLSGKEDSLLSQAEKQNLQNMAEEISLQDLMHIIRLFLRAYKDLSFSPSPEIPALLSSIEAALKKQGTTAIIVPKKTDSVPSHKNSESNIPKPLIVTSEEPEKFSNITMQELENLWPRVLDGIRELNSPLATLVKNSPVLRVSNGVIVLGVKYLFHKENLESTKNQALIMQVLKETSGKSLGFKAEVQKSAEADLVKDEAGALADALKVFGGELVD